MSEPFGVGLIYEDCGFHPVLCTHCSFEDDDLEGISLVDGSAPRGCSIQHCGPIPLTVEQAVWIKEHFAEYVQARTAGRDPDDLLPQ